MLKYGKIYSMKRLKKRDAHLIASRIGKVAKVSLCLVLSLILSSPLYALSGSDLDRFSENDILFYDCERSGNVNADPVSGGCAALGQLRTEMWNAASDSDKLRFMNVVDEENYGLAAVEGYMNQVLSKRGAHIGNDGTLAGWLKPGGQCEEFMQFGPTICHTEKDSLTEDDQVLINLALGGSNVTGFAVGNATGGSDNTGAGKISCVWKKDKSRPEKGYCRTDVEYGGAKVCAAYSPSELFGECWGDEHETGWIKQMTELCPLSASSIPASRSTTVVSGSDNSSAALGFLMDNGYTHQSAAAIVGNLQAESGGLNPRRFEGGSTASEDFRLFDKSGNPLWEKIDENGFGIAQWTTRGRQLNLQNYADSKDLPVISFDAQIGFMLQELTGAYKNHASPDHLNSLSLEEATFEVYRYYETPGSSFWTTRKGKYYNDYDPKTFSMLDESKTPAAYKAWSTRLGYAKQFLTTTPSSPDFSSGLDPCVGSTSTSSPWAGGEAPVYLQCDRRWGNLMYGSRGINGSSGKTICKVGCGPASFAMLATMILGREILPSETADVAGKAGMYIWNSGSSHSITKVLAEHYGLQYQTIKTSRATVIEDVSRALREGWMIHNSGGGRYGSGAHPYSKNGHYIGIRGITADGKWLISDSAGRDRKQDKHWDPREVVAAGMDISNLRAIRR